MNQFADQLKRLRGAQNYSMQQLADLANVSKSMISKIERGEVQPTLDIATRLAHALGRSLSAMLETQTENTVIKMSRAEQPIWEDPTTHSLRRVLSPSFANSQLEWLEITTPPHTKLALSPLKKGSEKYVLIIEGKITIEIGEQSLSLVAGDSGYFAADYPHVFINSTDHQALYYLIIKNGRDSY